jgi:hypothetical protein
VASSSSETEMEMPWISDDDDGMAGAQSWGEWAVGTDHGGGGPVAFSGVQGTLGWVGPCHSGWYALARSVFSVFFFVC